MYINGRGAQKLSGAICSQTPTRPIAHPDQARLGDKESKPRTMRRKPEVRSLAVIGGYEYPKVKGSAINQGPNAMASSAIMFLFIFLPFDRDREGPLACFHHTTRRDPI